MNVQSNRLKKLNILEKSLELEWLLSKVLSDLFRIEEQSTSISFGQTGQSLSFNQKVNLLLDSRDIDKAAKKNLQCFMEIRNKFMHNQDVITYQDACTLTKRSKYLKSQFLNCFIDGDIEEQFENSIEELYRSCAISIIESEGLSKELFEIEKYREQEITLRKILVQSIKESITLKKSTIDLNKIFKAEEVIEIIDDIGEQIKALYILQAMNIIRQKNRESKIDE